MRPEAAREELVAIERDAPRCATRALGLMLTDAAAEGLGRVEVTTDVDNVASQRVIEANGGVLIERFVNDAYGPLEKLRYRIALPV